MDLSITDINSKGNLKPEKLLITSNLIIEFNENFCCNTKKYHRHSIDLATNEAGVNDPGLNNN